VAFEYEVMGLIAVAEAQQATIIRREDRVVMRELMRLGLESVQLETWQGVQCHTLISISSSAMISKARAE